MANLAFHFVLFILDYLQFEKISIQDILKNSALYCYLFFLIKMLTMSTWKFVFSVKKICTNHPRLKGIKLESNKIFNISFFTILVLTTIGCKNQLYNYSFQKMGIFDDRVVMKSFNYKNKEITFIPMKHIGTEEFYTNVGAKIDSLKALNFYFITEQVATNDASNEDLLKFRKILGVALPKKGYEKIIDSIQRANKLSFRREVTFQPTYSSWKLDSTNTKNVDASIYELVRFYESKYGTIILKECDFAVPDITNSTKCGDSKNAEKYNAVVLEYRNKLLAKWIINSTHKKVAIIYGAGHFDGVKKNLEESSETK